MNNSYPNFMSIFNNKPVAVARVRGSNLYPQINGQVWFYQMKNSVLVVADVTGLPSGFEKCKSPIFAFHIHGGNSCTGDEKDPFSNAGMHYNPHDCLHPYHAGDLPPLFSTNGYAFCAVLTDRFKIDEIIGKTIIIHSSIDDFASQPSGNAGVKIACGKISLVNVENLR